MTPLENLNMKKLNYILFPVLFLMTSCYIYKPYSATEEIEAPARSENPATRSKSLRGDDKEVSNTSMRQKNEKEAHKGMTPEEEALLKQKELEKQSEEQAQIEKQKEEKQETNSFTSADGTVKNTTVTDKGKPKTTPARESGEVDLKSKLKPNRFYKVTVFDKKYKIQVDKWEGDTLVSHKIRKPEKQYKFHLNDIDEEALLERRFSKPFSDLLTVGAYAVGGAAVLLLVL